MISLINGNTGTPVLVPEAYVERFLAAGFRRPAAAPTPEPVAAKPATSKRRASKSE